MAVRKDFKKVIDEARRQGWTTEYAKGGKVKLFAPDGVHIVLASATPSKQNAVRNLIADLRQYGFVWEGH